MKIINRLMAVSALLLCTATAVYAQGRVTLYGILDSNLEVTNAGNGTTARMDSGSLLGSRFGIQGVEDIGGGNHVNFALEQGYLLNNGAAATEGLAFSRQAWIGLSGDWGEVRIGRQNSPLYIPLSSRFDAFLVGTIATALGNLQSITARVSNAIYYSTPTLSGLSAQFMVGLRDSTTEPTNGVANYHVVVTYKNGPLDVGAGYQEANNDIGTSTLKVLFAGGNYKFGKLTVYGVYNRGQQTDGTVKTDVFTTSALYEFTPSNLLSIGCGYAHDLTGAGNNARQVGAMYRYLLSKRTLIYTSAAFLQNRNNATYRLTGGTQIGIPAAFPGADARGVELGMQHLF
jgi:predicted porin